MPGSLAIPQLLNAAVDHLAGLAVLVATRWREGLDILDLAHPEATENAIYGGQRGAEIGLDPLTGPLLIPKGFDLTNDVLRSRIVRMWANGRNGPTSYRNTPPKNVAHSPDRCSGMSGSRLMNVKPCGPWLLSTELHLPNQRLQCQTR